MKPHFFGLSRKSFHNGRIFDVTESYFNACIEELQERSRNGEYIEYHLEQSPLCTTLYINL